MDGERIRQRHPATETSRDANHPKDERAQKKWRKPKFDRLIICSKTVLGIYEKECPRSMVLKEEASTEYAKTVEAMEQEGTALEAT